MGYDTGGVRDGAGRAGSAREAADSAWNPLRGLVVDGGAFGDVAAASGLASGLGAARDSFSRTGFDVSERHAALDGRARHVAAQGDALVPETTRHALRGSISDAMRGE
jgi:hypothetical protein